MIYDFCVIGGGIVGLATALELSRARPGAGILLVEKERALARHQTGHNSGVIHAGLYYKPGSLKAELCKRGARDTVAFCAEHGIPYETRGKLVVATTPPEVERLAGLRDNARANGIAVEEIDAAELKRREPNVAGLRALFAPTSGIVDYAAVCARMGELLERAGARVERGAAVTGIAETPEAVTVAAGDARWTARKLVACAGLQSDRLARLAGLTVDHRIVPFRGEYYDVAAPKRALVHHLIYPVPDPALPFLGIHLTPTIDGGLTVGPNAVLGFAREGYPRLSVAAADVASYARFPGFWRAMARTWRPGLAELRNSLFKRRYLEACRTYCPALELDDLIPREAGIRAQAVLRDGTLAHDFLFVQTARMLHVCNAPSPAATSALPIARTIVERLAA